MNLSQKIARMIVEGRLTSKACIEVLEERKLLSLLPTILRLVKHSTRTKALEDTIRIESPFPLSDKAVATVKRIVGNDLAPHITVINKDILLGFRARCKGRLYDASALRIIEQLK